MKNKHIGSSFDDFLKEEEIYEEVTDRAIKKSNSLPTRTRDESPKHHTNKNG
ncbi:MAG: hypothetical protein Q9M39_09385 [Sulfurovum sp.]|nr:hypothetical protein [Sulfurovum sp.]